MPNIRKPSNGKDEFRYPIMFKGSGMIPRINEFAPKRLDLTYRMIEEILESLYRRPQRIVMMYVDPKGKKWELTYANFRKMLANVGPKDEDKVVTTPPEDGPKSSEVQNPPPAPDTTEDETSDPVPAPQVDHYADDNPAKPKAEEVPPPHGNPHDVHWGMVAGDTGTTDEAAEEDDEIPESDPIDPDEEIPESDPIDPDEVVEEDDTDGTSEGDDASEEEASEQPAQPMQPAKFDPSRNVHSGKHGKRHHR